VLQPMGLFHLSNIYLTLLFLSWHSCPSSAENRGGDPSRRTPRRASRAPVRERDTRIAILRTPS
jgi:hypothetical protein